MNKSQLKSYAPRARRDFIQMIRQQADVLGLTKTEIDKPKVQGDIAIIEGRPYPARHAELRNKLAAKIKTEGLEAYLDRIAYSWFNRFAALRFMEVNGYLSHPFRVLSNRDAGKIEPEILEHATEVTLAGLDKGKVLELKLAGNKDAELYKMLLIAQCNELHAAMPFLFERINDETEILLSDNLLHSDSVIRKMVSEIDEDNWQQVEIIGWLYQFYISEKKDEVIGKTVKSEDIPAATQLFTPNWIVKYMTQNSLGRLWLEANPDSSLKTSVPMEFYIEPTEDNPKVEREAVNPEEITVLDPACGSGHILVEAYDLLKAIYTERGYSSRDIPRLILEKNLFGLDIDERAAQLSNFALLMKARADDPKIFEQHAFPNILTVPDSSTLENEPQGIAEMFLHGGTVFDSISTPIRDADYLFSEMDIQPSLSMDQSAIRNPQSAIDVTERNITDLLNLFAQGKTLGSLIRIPDGFEKVIDNIEASIAAKFASSDMMEQIAARQLVPFVGAAKMLARKYDCVIANPPYMGIKGMNADLKAFAATNFPDSKSDLFAMFIERGFELAKSNGLSAMVTLQNWMFLSSFAGLRALILADKTIENLLHIGFNSFPSLNSKIALATAVCFRNKAVPELNGVYINLNDAPQAADKEQVFRQTKKYVFLNQINFQKIPGFPIAYWLSDNVRQIFSGSPSIQQAAESMQGMITGDNSKFLRVWFEIEGNKLALNKSEISSINLSHEYWIPYNKGGDLRKWYGNNEWVLDWRNEGRDLVRSRTQNAHLYLQPGVTWTFISIIFVARYFPNGFLWDVSGSGVFAKSEKENFLLLGLMCSNLSNFFLDALNPTLNYQVENILAFPVHRNISTVSEKIIQRVGEAVDIARSDWDSFETSWDFKTFPIVDLRFAIDKPPTDSIEECCNRWNELTGERISRMQELETENNRLFIDAYGLQDELKPDVPPEQITLARADKEKDTRRLLSYFIGCLMGRYSLDEPGLIYADAGDVGFDPSRYKAFPVDDDGIVPVTDIEWFPQEAASKFVEFIRVTFGEPAINKNLQWISNQLGAKTGEEPIDTIRRYFSSSFFKDHMQIYKKRPIYWLFSSGKQKAFECLVYLHRYNESTLSRMRHEYVLPLMSKIEAQIDTNSRLIETSTSTSEKNKLDKQIETLRKKRIELAQFDEKLNHYANMRISLDLDDGVKVNYGKFGDLLAEVKAIAGTKERSTD